MVLLRITPTPAIRLYNNNPSDVTIKNLQCIWTKNKMEEYLHLGILNRLSSSQHADVFSNESTNS